MAEKKYRFTPNDYRKQRNAGDIGAGAGFVAGGMGGFQAVKGVKRSKQASRAGKAQYKASRTKFVTHTNDVIGGHSPAKSAGEAAKTTAGAMRHLPKTKTGIAGVGGAYAGAITGAVVGDAKARSSVINRQKKRKDALAKSFNTSAFGVEHG